MGDEKRGLTPAEFKQANPWGTTPGYKFVLNNREFWISKGPETAHAFHEAFDCFACTRCGHECDLETAVMVLGRLHHRVCPTLDGR